MQSVNEKEFESKSKEPIKQNISADIKIPSDSGTVIIDLEKFIKFSSIKKELVVGDIKIVMKTLTDEERAEATNPIKIEPDESVLTYLEKIKKPLLSRAIVKIDNAEFRTKENKDTLLDYLNRAQGALIDRIWAEYEKLLEEQQEILGNEEIKKK